MRLSGAPHPAADPHLDADPLEVAERLAAEICGEPFSWFRSQYFDLLPRLSPTTLAALAAELYVRLSADHAFFVLSMSHEMRRPAYQRRSPEQLLEHMTTNFGFRSPPTMAQRRAAAAFLHELTAPPQHWASEQARLAYICEQARRVLHARAEAIAANGNDPVFPQHLPALQDVAASDGDVDETAIEDAEELCGGLYGSLAAPDPGAPLLPATLHHALH
jgi:hypothetical protein